MHEFLELRKLGKTTPNKFSEALSLDGGRALVQTNFEVSKKH